MEMCGATEVRPGMPGVVVETDIMVVFKRLLDRHIEVQGIEGYESRTGR